MPLDKDNIVFEFAIDVVPVRFEYAKVKPPLFRLLPSTLI
jgi:hypothetical protein